MKTRFPKSLAGAGLLAALAAAPLANAQSLPAGVSISGGVQLAYSSNTGSEAYVPLSLSYDSGTNWGVEVGLEGYYRSSFEYALRNATVYYDTSFGRFSVGKPAALFKDYDAAAGAYDYYQMQALNGMLYGSVLDSNPFDFSGPNYYGARFDGSAGALDYGVMVAGFTDGSDMMAQVAASYSFGNYTLSGFVESDPSAPVTTGYAVSLAADYGNFGGVLSYGKSIFSRTFGTGEANYTATAYYTPLEDLELSASYVHDPSFSSGDLVAGGAKYTFWKDAYVGAMVTNRAGSYMVYAGWDFTIGR